MLVQLPEEQTQEIQQMIATLIKNEIHHFKEDIGADSTFLNKKQTYNYLGISNNTLDIGIAMGLSLHDQQKLLMITGFLGSFTTFSSFSAELSEKLLTGKWLEFSLTLGLHLVGGILLTVMGIILTRTVVSG